MALSDGLVGYWSPWLGSSGYRLLDRTQYANHGTLTNMDAGTDWVGATIQGRSGYALDFDGTNDYVATTLSNGLSNSFTFSCWALIRTLDNAVRPFITSQVASYGNYWASLGTFQGRLSFGLFDGANNPLTGSTGLGFIPNTNQWYHFVGVRDVGLDTIADYVNGSFNRSVTDSTTSVPSYGALTMGGQTTPAGRWVNGQIADVAIWNRALTASEIQAIYRLGPGWYRPYAKRSIGYAAAGFKAYWHRRQQQVIGGGLR